MKSVALFAASIGAVLMVVSAAEAVPVAPVLPDHSWLLDQAESNGSVAPFTGGKYMYGDYFDLNLPIGSGDIPLQLVQTGSSLAGVANPVVSGAPFTYSGNHSVLSDWRRNHPAEVGAIFGERTYQRVEGSLPVGTSGTIAFWFNPVRHDSTGVQFLFSLTSSAGPGLLAYAPSQIDNYGVVTNIKAYSFITTSSYSVPPALVTNAQADLANWSFDYGAADNGAPGPNWYHLAFTWNPVNSIQVYRNGALVATGTGVVQAFTADTIMIGGLYNGYNQAPGLYDEVGIWSSALTSDNVSWLAQNSLVSLVPEPATAGILVPGLIALIGVRRRFVTRARRRQSCANE